MDKEKIDRPLDPLALKTAKEIVRDWDIICKYEDGYYYGHSKQFPNVYGDGDTKEECIKDAKEALEFFMAYKLEKEADKYND